MTCAKRGLPTDIVIRVAVVSPWRHAQVVRQQDTGERSIELISMRRNVAIRQMQAGDQRLAPPQAAERYAGLGTTNTSEIESRCNCHLRVRSFAVSYCDNLYQHVLRQCDLNEASRAEHFIVRMRRDHHKATCLNWSEWCQLFEVTGGIPPAFARTEMLEVDDQCHNPAALASRSSSVASDPP